MALWGKSDSLFSPGTVTVDYSAKTIVGSGTSFRSSGISTGNVIVIGAGGTLGQAVISGITSETLISIATTQYLTTGIVGAAYTLTQKPIYTLEDKNYSTITGAGNSSSTNAVYGVDEYEAAANASTGSKYKVAHAGWVGIHTYIDTHGNLRVKSEVLVAMSGISSNTGPTYGATGDAADDTVFPDRYINITTQPLAVGIATTGSGTFSVTAAAVPAAALSYQWQVSTNNGTSYSSATGGIYSDDTTATLTITNPTSGENNNLYRVLITSTGGATATSNAAKLTVTA